MSTKDCSITHNIRYYESNQELHFQPLLRKRLCAIVSDPPRGKRPVDKEMKLANEIKPYIKKENGKITIKIKK